MSNGGTYDVVLTLTEDMLGTVPKNKDLYADYIAAAVAKRAAQEAFDNMEAISEEVATVPVDEEKGWTGFHTDEKGLFIYDYMVKGFIKEAGNTLKDNFSPKVKNLKSKLDSYVFVFPRRIRLGDKTKPDGVFERPLRAMTMQGPRVTLVRSDLVEAGTELKCRVMVLEHPEITESVIRGCLEYGALKGLGQFRNGSFGRFEFKMKRV